MHHVMAQAKQERMNERRTFLTQVEIVLSDVEWGKRDKKETQNPGRR